MKILIIDGNNLVHRVFWISKNQAEFNRFFHVHMFLTCVKSYVQDFEPDVVFCVWDEKTGSNINPRKQLCSQYKENRAPEKTKDVHSQNALIKGLLKTLGVKNILPLNYEADDAIAIIHSYYKGNKIKIVTADNDLCQLVDDLTVIFNPIKKINININNFTEKLGVPLNKFILSKAIQGDKSDNIPGVPGMGVKKTQKILNGEITLNEEQQKIVQNNLELIDISKTILNVEEKQAIEKQIQEEKNTYNIEAFKRLCEICKFQQITENIKIWEKHFNTK